jgi:uncharacterized protein with von Willebrand factor type A (vWA) domain
MGEWGRMVLGRRKAFARAACHALRATRYVLARAREAIRRMRFGMERFPTRRTRADPARPARGRARHPARRAAQRGHDLPLRRRRAREEAPPLVVLCDI